MKPRKAFIAAAIAAIAGISSAFDANTIAFYAFDGKTAGASVLNATVSNKVDSSKYAGFIYQATGVDSNTTYSVANGGQASWSADSPGKYVFAKRGYKTELLCTDPGSVSILDRSNGRGIICAFDSLGKELGDLSEWTVEWFWKFPPGTAYWTGNHIFRLPLRTTDTTGTAAGQLSLSITADSYFRLHGSSQASGVATLLNLNGSNTYDPHKNGLWHHCAISYKNGKATMTFDYKFSGSTTQTLEPTENPVPLYFPGTGSAGGSFSCIRVSNKSLSVSDYMIASNDPDCYPRTVFHWGLDGEVGTDSPSTASNRMYSTSAGVLNAGFYAMTNFTGIGTYYATTNGIRSEFADTLPRGAGRRGIIENRKDVVLGEDCSSLRLKTLPLSVSAPTTDPIWTTGTRIAMPALRFPPVNSSFTMELFAKINFKDWNINTQYTAGNRRRTTIMGMDGGYAGNAWELEIIPTGSGTGVDTFKLIAYDTVNSSAKSVSPTASLTADGKWHHIAVTYDHTDHKMRFYLDYVQKGSALQLDGPLKFGTLEEQSYSVGGGLNNHSFDGWMDEVRLVRECLPPEKFLHLVGLGGTMLIFR